MIVRFLSAIGGFIGAPAVLPWILLACIAGGGGLYLWGKIDGRAEERAAQAVRTQRAVDRAQSARDRVNACLDGGGRWVQHIGRCELPSVSGP